MLLDGLRQEIEPVWGKKEEARRKRLRRASGANLWRGANKSPTHITTNTSLKSLSNILFQLWRGQPPGWAVIRAYSRGPKRGRIQWWFRSDEITPKRLERWLKKHRAFDVEFCPVTFEQNCEHIDWNRFEFGYTNRREYPSYVEYGPLGRFREPDIIIEDRGLWLNEQQAYIDFQSRDGLFIWLPTAQLTATELISLYIVPVRRDLRHYDTDRSTLMWRIGKQCVRKGMRRADDIKTVIRASDAFQSRLEDRGERQAERGLDSDVRKLLAEARWTQ